MLLLFPISLLIGYRIRQKHTSNTTIESQILCVTEFKWNQCDQIAR